MLRHWQQDQQLSRRQITHCAEIFTIANNSNNETNKANSLWPLWLENADIASGLACAREADKIFGIIISA